MKPNYLTSIFWIFMIFYTLMLLPGCNTCGDDTDLGEHQLMQESLDHWYPYTQTDKLVFVNSTGDSLVFRKTVDSVSMDQFRFKELCSKGIYGESEEYFKAETRKTIFEAAYKGRTFLLKNILSVTPAKKLPDFTLYDHLIYGLDEYEQNPQKANSSVFNLVASYRNNVIPKDSLDFIADVRFYKTMNLGNISFSDVWTYNFGTWYVELFIQKNIGVIAIVDSENKLWIRI